MMVVVQLLFLIYTLFMAEQYLVMKISSREHRLLPVILVLAGLYNFYQVVYCVTGAEDVFHLLKSLLMVQVLFGVVHYKKDYVRLKFPIWIDLLLFLGMIFFDIMILFDYINWIHAPYISQISVAYFIAAMLIMNVYILRHVIFNKRRKMVGYILFSANSLVWFSLLSRQLLYPYCELLIPLSLAIAETAIYYLMKTGLIVDSAHLMQEQMYDTSDIATVLFDSDFSYIGMNQRAQELLGNETGALKEDSPKRKEYEEWVKNLLLIPDHEDEIKYNGGFYKQYLQKEYYQGRLRGYIFCMIDITKEKQENMLMESLKIEAESAAKMKSRFLARMSHELRSPLHAILGFSDILMMKKEISSQNRSLVKNIKDSGNILLTLVNTILDYSKIESGKIEIQEKSYQLERIVRDIAGQCMINVADKDIDTVVEIGTEYPSELIGDELRVREILQNLLSNAAKYTIQGSIHCVIAVEPCEDEEQVKIKIVVSDTGIGMSNERLTAIFDEYISYGDEKKIEGTGLGLPIVKQLTELMNGEITVESKEKEGSTFSVYFYQKVQTKEKNPPISFTKEMFQKQSNSWKPIVEPSWVYPDAKVLVVDDMKVNLELFRELTEPWKIQLDMAESGKEAIELTKQKDYQMIFMDNMMPGMSGIEAAAFIRACSDVPIILLTADISDETKTKSLQNGATEFLEKPIKEERLSYVIETYLPSSLREVPTKDHRIQIYGFTEIQKKTLQSFLSESSKFANEMKDLWEQNDLELFRIKVHGIKGAARNFGLNELGDKAEVLEMAVKAGHAEYIRTHIDEFLDYFYQVIEQLKDEVKLEEVKSDLTTTNVEQEMTVAEAFTQLKEGFDDFDMPRIEEIINFLLKQELSKEDQLLLKKVEQCKLDYEYEEGSQLIEQRFHGFLEE